jgi:GTP-binding protein Era
MIGSLNSSTPFRSGFVPIVGAPNVGKSTLLNSILGQKISIVTPKPQTTRNQILGIKRLPEAEIAFLDTPGIHRPLGLMNKRMVQAALDGLERADVVLWVLDGIRGLTSEDRDIAERLSSLPCPSIQVLNKIDRMKKTKLLPLMEECAKLLQSKKIIPLSARTTHGVEILIRELVVHLPERSPLGLREKLANQTERFLAAEAIREQIFILTHKEVPYSCGVMVERLEERAEKDLVVIGATVLVERESHKPILIGQRGSRLREIGMLARREIEILLNKKVYLELFVKTKEGWSENLQTLKEMGI